jgi:uncharacterized protein DUF1707
MNDAMRIGHAEREQAATALGEHFSAGRLDAQEFDDRVQRVYSAKTAGELEPLFADLPRPKSPAQGVRRQRVSGLRVPVTMLLLALLALMVFTALSQTPNDHFPPLFLFPVIWLFWARHFHARHPTQHR